MARTPCDINSRGSKCDRWSKRSIGRAYLLARLKVAEIMTREPTTISQEATISAVAQIMLERKFSWLPVVDEAGQLVGIITESDIFRLVVREWGRA